MRKASRKTFYSALNTRPLPRNRITVLLCVLEERFCEFGGRDIPPLHRDVASTSLRNWDREIEIRKNTMQLQWLCCTGRERKLAGGLIFAGRAARLAVHETVFADPHVDDGLAKNAEFFALAGVLGLVALCALEFCRACTGAHAANLSRPGSEEKMTLVTARPRKSGRAEGPYFGCAL